MIDDLDCPAGNPDESYRLTPAPRPSSLSCFSLTTDLCAQKREQGPRSQDPFRATLEYPDRPTTTEPVNTLNGTNLSLLS